MKKRFRLLLLYFGRYKLTLFYFSIDRVTNPQIMKISLCYRWKYGTLRIDFSSPDNEVFAGEMYRHYKVSKESKTEYTFDQLREIEHNNRVFEFILEAEYDGTKKVQGSVGVN